MEELILKNRPDF